MIKEEKETKKFYPPIFDRMPDANGVGVGTKAVGELPKDRFYNLLALKFKTNGSAMTIANMRAMISGIKVSLDGIAIWDIDISELISLNLYYHLRYASFTDGIVIIPFMRPWHFEYAQGKALGLGTKGLNSFTVKVQFTDDAVAPSMEIYASTHRFNEEPGNFVWVKSYSRPVSGTGEVEIDTLPKNGDLIAAHFIPSAGSITDVRLRVNSLDYVNMPSDVLMAIVGKRRERTPQSGIFHYDLLSRNYPEDRMPQQYYDTTAGAVKTLDDIRWFVTCSAAATIKIVQETIAPLKGYNAYS